MAQQSFTPTTYSQSTGTPARISLAQSANTRSPRIDSAFAGSAERYLGELDLFGDGSVDLGIVDDQTEGPDNVGRDLLPAFEQNGSFIVTRGSLSLTVVMANADTTDPYVFTPANSGQVTAFVNAVIALTPNPAASSFTITLRLDLHPTAPNISNKSNMRGVSIGTVTLPTGSGGDPPLIYSASNLPPGLSFSAFTRRVTGTPSAAGTYQVTYRVTDSDGDSDSETFTWTITAPPDLMPTAPTIANRTSQAGVSIGTVTLPTGSGGDPPLIYSASNLPPGLSFSAFTRRVTGTPSRAGTYQVTYRVTDDDGDSDSETFDWTITPAGPVESPASSDDAQFDWTITAPPDLMPTAPTIANRTSQAGVSIGTVTLPQGSGGDPPLSYSAGGLPPGLSFTSSTRRVTGTPSAAGTYQVTYRVTDSDGDSDSETFTWTITPAGPVESPASSDDAQFDWTITPAGPVESPASSDDAQFDWTITPAGPVESPASSDDAQFDWTITPAGPVESPASSDDAQFDWTITPAGPVESPASSDDAQFDWTITPAGPVESPASSDDAQFDWTITPAGATPGTDDSSPFTWDITTYDPSSLPSIPSQTNFVGQLVDLSFLLRNTTAGFSQVTFNLPPGVVDAARDSADGFHIDFDGTPTVAGRYDVTVTVYYRATPSDPQEVFGTVNFTWTITAVAPQPPAVGDDTGDDAPITDPAGDTGVSASPRTQSLPYSGRIRLTPPRVLGPGSPLGQQRAFQELTIGLYRSSGGVVRQAGQHRMGASHRIVTPGDDDPQNAEGYRVFTGEVSVTLHDLFTDPTATVQIEQHEPLDLEITYISMDIEHED